MDAAFADTKDDLFGAVYGFVYVLAFVVGEFGNFSGGGDEAAKDSGALDDASVVVYVDGGGGAGDEVGNVGGAADFFELVAAFKFERCDPT